MSQDGGDVNDKRSSSNYHYYTSFGPVFLVHACRLNNIYVDRIWHLTFDQPKLMHYCGPKNRSSPQEKKHSLVIRQPQSEPYHGGQNRISINIKNCVDDYDSDQKLVSVNMEGAAFPIQALSQASSCTRVATLESDDDKGDNPSSRTKPAPAIAPSFWLFIALIVAHKIF